MSRSLALMLLPLTLQLSCADGEVRLRFDLPARFRTQVASVVVEVYRVEGQTPPSCETLSYRSPTEGPQPSASIQSDTSEIKLPPLPRSGDKLVVARGLDAQGLMLVAGCAEIGPLERSAEFEIEALPATLVRLDEIDAVRIPFPGVVLPPAVALTISDVFEEALANAPLRWRLVAPGALGAAENSARTDASGKATLTLDAVTAPGPAELRIRTRWARERPVFARGLLRAPEVEIFELPEPALVHAVGPIGPIGEMGLVSLISPEENGEAQLALTSPLTPARAQNPLVVVSEEPMLASMPVVVPDGGAGRVLWISPLAPATPRWLEVDGDGRIRRTSSSSPPGIDPELGFFVPTMVAAVPSCGAKDPSVKVWVSGAGGSAVYEVDGSGPDTSHSLHLSGAWSSVPPGCIGTPSGESHAAVAFFRPAEGALLGVTQSVNVALPRPVEVQWSSWLVEPALSPARLAAPMMIGTELQPDGNRLHVFELDRSGERTRLRSAGIVPVPGPVYGSAIGDLDGDALADVVTLIQFPADQDERPEYALYLIYAVKSPHPLTGTVGLLDAQLVEPWLAVADMDQDGFDDIVVVERNGDWEEDQGPRPPDRIRPALGVVFSMGRSAAATP